MDSGQSLTSFPAEPINKYDLKLKGIQVFLLVAICP